MPVEIHGTGEMGGVKIVSGSYTGTGLYGSNHPNTLTFPFVPKLIYIAASPPFGMDSNSARGSEFNMLLMPGITECQMSSGRQYINQITYSGKTVSWYMDTEYYQLNSAGRVYYYFAIG